MNPDVTTHANCFAISIIILITTISKFFCEQK